MTDRKPSKKSPKQPQSASVAASEQDIKTAEEQLAALAADVAAQSNPSAEVDLNSAKKVGSPTAASEKTVDKKNPVEPAESEPPANQIPTQPEVIRVVEKKSSWLVWLVLLLTLMTMSAVAGLAWLFYTYQQQSQIDNNQLKQNLSQQQSTFQSQLNRDLQSFNQQWQSSALQQEQTLIKLMDELRRKHVDVNTESAMVDVTHLVNIAARKIWFEADKKSAIMILMAAQERINAFNAPHWLSIKKALSEDIGMLKSLHTPDIESTYMQLQSLATQVLVLPLYEFELNLDTQTTDALELSASTSDWQSNLYKTWQHLTQDFMTVRRRDEQVAPLMSSESERNLRQNLLANIVQAQTALLNKKAKIYENALLEAIKWLEKYYAANNPEVMHTIAELKLLAKQELAAGLPDVTLTSQAVLAKFSRQVHLPKTSSLDAVSQPVQPKSTLPQSNQEIKIPDTQAPPQPNALIKPNKVEAL